MFAFCSIFRAMIFGVGCVRQRKSGNMRESPRFSLTIRRRTLFISAAESALAGIAARVPVGSGPAPSHAKRASAVLPSLRHISGRHGDGTYPNYLLPIWNRKASGVQETRVKSTKVDVPERSFPQMRRAIFNGPGAHPKTPQRRPSPPRSNGPSRVAFGVAGEFREESSTATQFRQVYFRSTRNRLSSPLK
jgi:hypothetical protein